MHYAVTHGLDAVIAAESRRQDVDRDLNGRVMIGDIAQRLDRLAALGLGAQQGLGRPDALHQTPAKLAVAIGFDLLQARFKELATDR